MSWLSRVANALRSERTDRELDEELLFHLEARQEELMRQGMNRADAARAARMRLGNSLALREQSRDVRLAPVLESLARDVRLAARVLLKDGVAALAAVLSLAMAIGACTAAFALIDALILRPLPVPDPQRLFYVTTGPQEERASRAFSYPALQHLRAGAAGAVELFAASSPYPNSAFLEEGREEKLRNSCVSGNFFAALGLRPATGRLLTEEDEKGVNEHPYAVLSYGFWMRRFAGDPAVVGKHFRFGGFRYEIVGVAQKGFTGIEPGSMTDAWMPVTMGSADSLTKWGWQWLWLGGRLKPGVTPQRARQELQAALTNAHREWLPDLYRQHAPPDAIAEFLAEPLHLNSAPGGPSDVRSRFARPLLILGIVAGLVLLIACSNLANLFLARAAAREREMALRVAIGAGRGKLVQQVMVEGALVAAAACVLGLAIGALAAPLIVRMLGHWDLPVYLDVSPGWRMSAFAAAASLLATLLFALAPALRASGVAPLEALKGGGSRGRARAVPRQVLAAQIALSFTVLFVAGMLVLSFEKLIHVDLGFSRDRVVQLNLARNGKPDTTASATTELLERVRAVPGVRAAAISEWGVFSGAIWTDLLQIPGHAPDAKSSVILPVTPGFFETMGIRLLAGRDFSMRDRDSSTAVVNRAFARYHFPSEDSLGKHFILPPDDEHPERNLEIVGVVSDSHYLSVRDAAPMSVYIPSVHLQGTLAVRTVGDPLLAVPRIRDAVTGSRRTLRIQAVVSQATLVDDALIRERLLAFLAGFFALAAVVLAAVGIYGMLSYSLVRRRREIGIRVALGARRVTVLRLVVGDIAAVVLVGLAAGLLGGNLLGGFLAKLLYGVKPTDVTSIALPLACLLGAAAIAAARPAMRAVSVDPAIALREE